ncbi:MAG: hypothetical protein ACRD3N_03870 [Terracidiphilus sp.]
MKIDAPQTDAVASVLQLRGQIEGLAEALVGQAQSAAAPTPEAASYALGIFTDPRQVFADLATSIQSLLMKLKPEGVVQTVAPGEFAQTVLNFTGRAVTVVSPNISLELEQNHVTSIQRTYALRRAVAGALAAAAAAALTIAASAANPPCLPQALSTACSLKDAIERLAAAAQAAA